MLFDWLSWRCAAQHWETPTHASRPHYAVDMTCPFSRPCTIHLLAHIPLQGISIPLLDHRSPSQSHLLLQNRPSPSIPPTRRKNERRKEKSTNVPKTLLMMPTHGFASALFGLRTRIFGSGGRRGATATFVVVDAFGGIVVTVLSFPMKGL